MQYKSNLSKMNKPIPCDRVSLYLKLYFLNLNHHFSFWRFGLCNRQLQRTTFTSVEMCVGAGISPHGYSYTITAFFCIRRPQAARVSSAVYCSASFCPNTDWSTSQPLYVLFLKETGWLPIAKSSQCSSTDFSRLTPITPLVSQARST